MAGDHMKLRLARLQENHGIRLGILDSTDFEVTRPSLSTIL